MELNLDKLTGKEKSAITKLKNAKPDKKLKNPGFNSFGQMIIYKYHPRCLHCGDSNKGIIIRTIKRDPHWECSKCGKVTESVYFTIKAPKY